MKIIKKKEINTIPFEDVKVGEIFENDSIYYMKVYYGVEGIYFVVCLEDGGIYNDFTPQDVCRVVNTELYILD